MIFMCKTFREDCIGQCIPWGKAQVHLDCIVKLKNICTAYIEKIYKFSYCSNRIYYYGNCLQFCGP